MSSHMCVLMCVCVCALTVCMCVCMYLTCTTTSMLVEISGCAGTEHSSEHVVPFLCLALHGLAVGEVSGRG